MIIVFIALYILALYWYGQISGYINHFLSVTISTIVVAVIMTIVGVFISGLFNSFSGEMYVVGSYLVFALLTPFCHLFLIFYPNRITKREKSNPEVTYDGLGKGGSILAIAMAVVCVSIAFATTDPLIGIDSLIQLTMWDMGILLILNRFIFIAAVFTTLFMLIWVKVNPDPDDA